MENNNELKPTDTLKEGKALDDAIWWAMLLVGVIAIPASAIFVTALMPFDETGKVITFVIACWGSTWVGMWLMRKSKEKNL